MMKGILSSLALALLLGGCCHFDDGGVEPQTSAPAKYIFQGSVLNYAWGFAHQGFSIDSAGQVYTFRWDFRGGSEWKPSPNGEYTVDELDAEFAPGRKYLRTIPKDSLAMMRKLMASATAGSYTDTTHTGADAGNRDMGFYTYDANRKVYRWIVLRRRGDFSFDNQSAAAKVIADWLDGIWMETVR